MADVSKLASIIFKWEGGFVNDPADSGGATNRGVTLATYKTYCKKKGLGVPTVDDLKAISKETATDVLRCLFWNPCKADLIRNQSIANLIVDNCWGSGLGWIKKVQEVLGVKADGIVGNVTLNALNGANQKSLFDRLLERRKSFYMDIVSDSVRAYERKIGRKATETELLRYTKKRFIKGWLNRLNDFSFSY